MAIGYTFYIKIEIDFSGAPLDTTLTWTDVTTYLLTETISVTRGRDSDLDMFSAGRASFVLRNADGRFDPRNASSPYGAGAIVPMRRLRILFGASSGTAEEVFWGFVEDWQPERIGARDIVRVSALDMLGAIFGQYTLGNETIYDGLWNGTPYTLPIPHAGNRPISVTTTDVVAAETMTIYGEDGGGVARTEPIAIGVGATTYTSIYNYSYVGSIFLSNNYPANVDATIHIRIGSTFPSELTDRQFDTLLNALQVPSTWRYKSTTSAKLASSYTVEGGPALYALERMMWSEGGAIFAGKSGKMHFYAEESAMMAPAAAYTTLSDGSTGESTYNAYSDIVAVSGTRYLRNDIRLDGLDGAHGSDRDEASAAIYGQRVLSRSELTIAGGNIRRLAERLLTKYKTMRMRYRVLISSAAVHPDILRAELLTRFDVRVKYPGAATYTTYSGRLEKIELKITATTAEMWMTLSPL